MSYKESGVPKFTVTIDNTYTKQTNTDHFKVQIKPHHIKIKPVKTLKKHRHDPEQYARIHVGVQDQTCSHLNGLPTNC